MESTAISSNKVPRIEDGWMTIWDFALSFDGYAYAEAIGQDMRQKSRDVYHAFQQDPDVLTGCSLENLRAYLFFLQRDWRHSDESMPNRTVTTYVVKLLEHIRALASTSNFTQLTPQSSLIRMCGPVMPGQPYYRPYVARRFDPAEKRQIWIVGSYPSTPIGPQHMDIDEYSKLLNDWEAFTERYAEIRRAQGKTRVSPTRRYMNEFETWLLQKTSANVIETNVNALPSPSSTEGGERPKDVKQRGQEVFRELLLEAEPNCLILYGEDARKTLSRFMRGAGAEEYIRYSSPSGAEVRYQSFLFPSGKRCVVLTCPHFLLYKREAARFQTLVGSVSVLLQRPPTDRHSWPTLLPLPSRRERLRMHFRVSSDDMERIRYGFYPLDMDEKWFVYMEGRRLFVHRSWTGYCSFEIGFEQIDGDYVSTEVWVNRDLDQYHYHNTNQDQEVEMLASVFEWLFGVRVRNLERG